MQNPRLSYASLCKVGKVSQSGLYRHLRNKDHRIVKDEPYLKVIKELFEKSKRKAGIRTLAMKLRRKNLKVNPKKIARIKRENGLITVIRKKNKLGPFASNKCEHLVFPNLLKRDFIRPLPDMAYVTDTSVLLFTDKLKVYLSATKDLGTNEIISYRVARSPAVKGYVDEFEVLLSKLPKHVKGSLLIHSDQGFQYTNSSFADLLKKHGAIQSMSRKANCHDNAAIETFFGHLKDELEIKRGMSLQEIEKEVDRAIIYYNNERPQMVLKGMTPTEYRSHLCSNF